MSHISITSLSPNLGPLFHRHGPPICRKAASGCVTWPRNYMTLGRPKTTTVRVGELYATRKRMVCVNWGWEDPSTNKPRYFYAEEAGSPCSVPTPRAIEAIARAIRSHTLNKAVGNRNGSPVVGKVPSGNIPVH